MFFGPVGFQASVDVLKRPLAFLALTAILKRLPRLFRKLFPYVAGYFFGSLVWVGSTFFSVPFLVRFILNVKSCASLLALSWCSKVKNLDTDSPKALLPWYHPEADSEAPSGVFYPSKECSGLSADSFGAVAFAKDTSASLISGHGSHSRAYCPNSSELELVLFVSSDSRDCGCKDNCFCPFWRVNLLVLSELGCFRTGSFFFITVLSFLFFLLSFFWSVSGHNLSRSCFVSLDRLGLYFLFKNLFDGL